MGVKITPHFKDQVSLNQLYGDTLLPSKMTQRKKISYKFNCIVLLHVFIQLLADFIDSFNYYLQ